MNALLLDIPLLDWTGPQFLKFYAAALVLTAVWCVRRARRAVHQFEVPSRRDEALTDPFEVAFLAGGAPRVALVTVTRLLDRGLLQWKKKRSETSLVRGPGVRPEHLTPFEDRVLAAVDYNEPKGMPVADATGIVASQQDAVEARLASLGLRPTQKERDRAGVAAVRPLLILGLIGVAKLGVGLWRGKPVLLLVALLGITWMVWLLIQPLVKRLTAAGEERLRNMRAAYPKTPAWVPDHGAPLDTVSLSLGLFGASVLWRLPEYQGMHAELDRQFNSKAAAAGSGTTDPGSSSGCGSDSSSGGSSDGGGSSGCGGCGGGGGD